MKINKLERLDEKSPAPALFNESIFTNCFNIFDLSYDNHSLTTKINRNQFILN
ncbi:hypothetical protein FC27_GL001890 [Companilactobacillus versmoldensis DSM 14857 = KCTC 3814]|uniref:Uncharacterized protein n=1 Tax=Companilactobacillus versmoldensis DSM 14857 = KCTC 3814 TaxID=1423815 RepID=A0A0R1SCJ2_9LACO|nr:hypothetical protein FC27_GL001890 [Companilactobacillus versmoldensis DSM 14857 = KCTC 3814]